MNVAKTRVLTQVEYNFRLLNGVCPRCGDYRLVRQMRVRRVDGDKPVFAGSYFTCGGPNAHKCYNLSGETGTRLSETTEGTEPVRMPKPSAVKSILRRRSK